MRAVTHVLSMNGQLLTRALWMASLWLVGLGVLAAVSAASAAERDPVVVELYTSQGCNTCPPADIYLGELAAREDVITLSLHIDYWDYIGWKDRFATPESTDRQYGYAQAMGERRVYTPQMVIHGTTHESGRRRASIEAIIERAHAALRPRVAVALTRRDDGTAVVEIPASDPGGPAEIWLMLVDQAHTVAIRSGENSGRTLTYHNVVREIVSLGTWDGEARRIPLSLVGADGTRRDGCVVIVQEAGLGPILGAAYAHLPAGS